VSDSLAEPGVAEAGVAEAGAEADPVAASRQALKGATVSGATVNLVSQMLRLVLTFAYQVAIARLLAPSDFGLVAMTAPVINFVQLFSDMGLSTATIQHPDINQAQLSFLFWVSAALGLALAVVAAAVSPLVGWFYGDPRLVDITIAAGALLLLGGIYSQHMALLNRTLRFRAVAAVELTSFAVGAVAGIGSAMLGLSYWAIIVNQAATSLTAMVLAWALSGWRPARPGRAHDMRALFRFGANLTGFSVVNFFSRSSQNVMIGRVWGEADLGLFDRAYKLVLLPFYQIAYPFTRVALPLLSKSQNEPEFYRRAYERLLESVLLMSYPGLVFALATHQQLVEHVLGARWAGVGPIFGFLVLDAFIAPIGSSMGWLFVSQGRTTEMRNWGVAASLMFVASFAAGLPWGPVGVAIGYVGAGVIELAVLWRVATRTGPLQGARFLPLLGPFIASALVTLAVLLWLAHVLRPGWFALGLCAAVSYVVFLSCMAALPRGRVVLRAMFGQARTMLRAQMRSGPRAA
jgi:PST family polysaccharide transporter